MFPNRGETRRPIQEWHRASELPAQTEHLAEVNAGGQNIYFGANPRRTKGGGTEHVALARCLFVDIDGVKFDEALRRIDQASLPWPTAIVGSGHGIHEYWRLDEALIDSEEWTARQKGLIRLVGTDPVVHDPPRVMRLPAFRNHRQPAADAVLIEADPRRTYPLHEFPNGIHIRKQGCTSQRSQQPLVNTPTSATSVRHTPEVRAAIALTLPDGPDQRRRKLFTLARLLKALPGFEGVDPLHLYPIVKEWHRRAEPKINHKQFEISFADFCDGWDRVRYPGQSGPIGQVFERARSQPLPPEAMQFPCQTPRLLVALCCKLQREAGDEPFWLDERTVAGLLGVNQTTANHWFRVLRKRRILERIAKGSPGRASHYRYIGTEGEVKLVNHE